MSVTQGQNYTADGNTLQLVAGQFSAKRKMACVFTLVNDQVNYLTTDFAPIAGETGVLSTTELRLQIPLPFAGTFKNLYVQVTSNNVNGTVVTLRKNGVDTALKVILPATNTLVSDTADSVAVVAGDLVCYGFTVGTSGLFTACVEFDPA